VTDYIDQPVPPFIRRAMQGATERELLSAVETFKEYMAIVWEIYQTAKASEDSPKVEVCDRVGNIDHV
jgi:hypothetical protein